MKLTANRKSFSPLARYSQLLSLSFAYAAGTYFRYTTKVGKGVPNERKGNKVALENRSERFSSPSFESPSSFDRSRFASVAEAPGAYRFDISS